MKDLTTVKQGKAITLQDRSEKCPTEERQILNQWTECCSDLYNYKANGDPSVLNCTQTGTENDHPILRREVEAAVQLLKKGKSAGVNNVPAELVQAGGEDVITALTTICNRIWQTGEWPTPWTQSLVVTDQPHQPPKQSHAEDHTEQIEATSREDHRRRTGGLQTRGSTTKQIFNLRILCEKYLQHQQNLYHVFIDFKKAFDRV